MSEIKKEDIKTVQEMLKGLMPSASADESIPIKDIPKHCASILTSVLNLEWFGVLPEDIEPGSARNSIIVRIAEMDMTLSEFFSRVRESLSRIEKGR